MITCTGCGVQKDVSSFYMNRYGRYIVRCKECILVRAAERYKEAHPISEYVPKTEKFCPSCETIKPAIEFYRCKSGRLVPHCIECSRAKYRNQSDRDRKACNLRKYGLTIDEYDLMLVSQQGRCALCGEVFGTDERKAIDHCHKSGKVRGLLHMSCNSLLGMAYDRIDVLERAVQYLKEHL